MTGPKALPPPASEDMDLLRFLAGGVSPAEAVRALGRPERTVRAEFARLEEAGLARRVGRGPATRWETTGAALAGLVTPETVPGPPDLGAWIARWPTAAHQAAMRLLITGTIARWHLGSVLRTGWGGLLIVGPTRTGKTTLATAAARVLGLDPLGVVRRLGETAPGELLGRRRPGRRWTFEASPLVGQPLLVLDEWQRASPDLRREASHLLLGQTEVQVEGQTVLVRPLVVLIANLVPTDLAEEVRRRSPTMDTARLEAQLTDVDLFVRRLEAGSWPRVDLEATRPSLDHLPEPAWTAGRSVLKNGLTSAGWRLCDPEAWLRPALGRLALDPMLDPAEAAVATALDCLALLATVPGAVDGERIGAVASRGGPEVLASAEAVERALAAGRSARERVQSDAVRADLALAETREYYRATIEQGLREAEPFRTPEARGMRAAARRALDQLGEARSMERLQAVWGGGAQEVAEALNRLASRRREARTEAEALAKVLEGRLAEVGRPRPGQEAAEVARARGLLQRLRRVRDPEELERDRDALQRALAALDGVLADRRAVALARDQEARQREWQREEEVRRRAMVRQLRALVAQLDRLASRPLIWEHEIATGLVALGLLQRQTRERLESRRSWWTGRTELRRVEEPVWIAADPWWSGSEVPQRGLRVHAASLWFQAATELESTGAKVPPPSAGMRAWLAERARQLSAPG